MSVSIERLVAWGGAWLQQGVDRLRRGATAEAENGLETRGFLQSMGEIWTDFSKRGLALAQRLSQMDATSKHPRNDQLELYNAQGQKSLRTGFEQSRSAWNGNQKNTTPWPHGPHVLSLSETARLAHGIATHAQADSTQQQKFIRHVRDERQQGGYDHQVFEQVRRLFMSDSPAPSHPNMASEIQNPLSS